LKLLHHHGSFPMHYFISGITMCKNPLTGVKSE